MEGDKELMNNNKRKLGQYLKIVIYLLILTYSYSPSSVLADTTNSVHSQSSLICGDLENTCLSEIITYTQPNDSAPVSYIYQTKNLSWDKLFQIITCQLTLNDRVWYKDKNLNYFTLDKKVSQNNSFQIRGESILECNVELKTITKIELFDTVFNYSDQIIYINNGDYYFLNSDSKANLCVFDNPDMISEVNLSQFLSLISINKFAGSFVCEDLQQITPIQSVELISGESTINPRDSEVVTTEIDILPRYQSAVDTALSMLGEVTQASGEPWNGWCDKFVAHTYGKSSSGYYSALVHYQALESLGLVHYQDLNVPPGGLAFFNATENNPYGHVMIAVGNGQFVSTGNTIHHETIESWKYGDYLGWAYPEDSW